MMGTQVYIFINQELSPLYLETKSDREREIWGSDTEEDREGIRARWRVSKKKVWKIEGRGIGEY